MATTQVKVPDIGDFKDVDVIEVLVKAGDRIAVDDAVITLESDKASMDVPSSHAGTVKEVHIAVGDKASEGTVVLTLETEGEAAADSGGDAAPASTEAAPAKAETAPAATSAPSGGASSAGPAFERVHASPSIRRLARERRIDLNQVKGSGRKGRVTREDLDRFQRGESQPAAGAAAPAGGGAGIPPMPAVDHAKFGEIEVLALNKIKRLTGINLSRAWLNVPHVTHHDETDIGELEAFRAALKGRAEKAGVKVTMLSFIIKACAEALKAFPSFNASLDSSGENLILKKYYNIGVAVDTPNGLVVPVIRDADKKGLFEISRDLMELSGKARDKKLKPGEMQGGTFTISSLGGIGGTAFTPIVNAPEVAILGLTRTQQRPVPKGQGFEFRPMLPMSLSYDHRVIDGAEAARFVRHLGELINDVRLLLI